MPATSASRSATAMLHATPRPRAGRRRGPMVQAAAPGRCYGLGAQYAIACASMVTELLGL